jgi:hypothetical protein
MPAPVLPTSGLAHCEAAPIVSPDARHARIGLTLVPLVMEILDADQMGPCGTPPPGSAEIDNKK